VPVNRLFYMLKYPVAERENHTARLSADTGRLMTAGSAANAFSASIVARCTSFRAVSLCSKSTTKTRI